MVYQPGTVDPARNETVIADNVTFDNFLKFFAEYHAEWLRGKVILVVSNNTRHQAILLFLSNLLNLFLGYKPLGKVLLAGVPMKISDNQPAREPDLLIILKEHADRIQETYINGSADIAVEIVSPESAERDRGDKLTEYEAAGVQEYWLFDPLRQEASIYSLAKDGRYRRLPLDAAGSIVSYLLPGFVLDPALLWREEMPTGPELIELVQGMTR